MFVVIKHSMCLYLRMYRFDFVLFQSDFGVLLFYLVITFICSLLTIIMHFLNNTLKSSNSLKLVQQAHNIHGPTTTLKGPTESNIDFLFLYRWENLGSWYLCGWHLTYSTDTKLWWTKINRVSIHARCCDVAREPILLSTSTKRKCAFSATVFGLGVAYQAASS